MSNGRPSRVAPMRAWYPTSPSCTLHDRVQLVHRQAETGQRGQQCVMGGRGLPAFHLAQAVGVEAQRPAGGDARVELAHDAGGGVARVHEGLVAAFALLLVHALEVIAAHVDLAAHFDHRSVGAFQPVRNLRNRADRVRDVLAGLAVAARRRLHQRTAFVAQVDGESVELQLGRIVQRGRGIAEFERLAHTRIETLRRGRAGIALGVDRQHRHRMPDRRPGRRAPRRARAGSANRRCAVPGVPLRARAVRRTAGRIRRRECWVHRARSSGAHACATTRAARRPVRQPDLIGRKHATVAAPPLRAHAAADCTRPRSRIC